MTVDRTLIVFVRAPAIGAVKRRLAAGIGPLAAHRLYVATTRRLLARVAGDPRWKTVLAPRIDAVLDVASGTVGASLHSGRAKLGRLLREGEAR